MVSSLWIYTSLWRGLLQHILAHCKACKFLHNTRNSCKKWLGNQVIWFQWGVFKWQARWTWGNLHAVSSWVWHSEREHGEVVAQVALWAEAGREMMVWHISPCTGWSQFSCYTGRSGCLLLLHWGPHPHPCHSCCKGSSALGPEIGHFHSFQSPQSCHASPLILDIATNSLIFPHISISPCIYALFIPPSISQFVIPCLVVFLFLLPLSDAPHCSSHSDFRVTMFQDHLSAVSNCDADSLKPSFLASCFLHHPSTIHSFYRFHCVLLTLLIFHLGQSTSCLSWSSRVSHSLSQA